MPLHTVVPFSITEQEEGKRTDMFLHARSLSIWHALLFYMSHVHFAPLFAPTQRDSPLPFSLLFSFLVSHHTFCWLHVTPLCDRRTGQAGALHLPACLGIVSHSLSYKPCPCALCVWPCGIVYACHDPIVNPSLVWVVGW